MNNGQNQFLGSKGAGQVNLYNHYVPYYKKLSLIVQFEIIYHNKLKRILRKHVDKKKT